MQLKSLSSSSSPRHVSSSGALRVALRDASSGCCRLCLLVLCIVNVTVWIRITSQMQLSFAVPANNNFLRASDLLAITKPAAPKVSTRGDPRDWNEPCVEMKAGHLETKYFEQVKHECFTRRRIQAIIVQLVHVTSLVFERNNISYWLDSGTLLGAVRDQGVIPHDTDADFGMDQQSYWRLRDSQLPPGNAFPKGYKMVVFNSSVHENGGRDANIPIRVIDTRVGLYVDVFVFFQVNDPSDNDSGSSDDKNKTMLCPEISWVFWNCKRCPETKGVGKAFRIPVNWVFPLRQCEFAKRQVSCPAQSDKYLDFLYGRNYMVPVKYNFD